MQQCTEGVRAAPGVDLGHDRCQSATESSLRVRHSIGPSAPENQLGVQCMVAQWRKPTPGLICGAQA
eukprot:107601-Pyramimonas_sp.AAC.2